MIIAFIKKVRSRLTLSAFIRTLIWILVCTSILTVVTGLSFILRGYSVPLIIYPIALGLVILISLIALVSRRISMVDAAAKADDYFQLKDSLTSSLEFQKCDHEVYQLQRRQTERRIEPINPKSIPTSIPRKLILAAALSVGAASAIGFVPPSEEVLLQREQERLTSERTREINEQLEKEIEEWINSLSDEEKEAVDASQLKRWVTQLKETGDKREALRNYARLEQKIQKSIDALDQRKDEELLKKAGLKLEQATKADTKNLGKDLKDKKFKEASEKLKKFKLSKNKDLKNEEQKKSGKLKKSKRPTKEQLEKMRKRLRKLRQLSKPLANAARAQAKAGNNRRAGTESDNQSGQAEQDLAEMLENLDQDAEDLEEWLDAQELDLQRDDAEWEEGDEDMEFFEGKLDDDLDQLRRRLRRMGARKKARKRLRSLSRSLSRAQSFASGNSQKLGLGQGGKKPGEGSSDSRRKAKDKLTDNGLFDKLKGQKGTGESLKSIEEADSGSGTSRRKGQRTERSFERQLNSFIERDDIPEEMKSGVKEYFKQVHELPPVSDE